MDWPNALTLPVVLNAHVQMVTNWMRVVLVVSISMNVQRIIISVEMENVLTWRAVFNVNAWMVLFLEVLEEILA